MHQAPRWTGIGIAIAVGFLVLLMLPVGSLFGPAGTGPAGGPADNRLAPGQSSVQHWLDRVFGFDLIGPGSLPGGASGSNLILLAAIVVLLLMLAPRLVLLVIALVVGLPLLLGLISFILPGGRPDAAPAFDQRAPWARLLEHGLFGISLETLVLLGIVVVIGIALSQQRRHESRSTHLTDGGFEHKHRHIH